MKAVKILKWIIKHLIQFSIALLVSLVTMIIAKYFGASELAMGFYAGATFLFTLEHIRNKII